MGELTFFLGLHVTQKDDGIFISQDKYVDEILKKFGFSTVKTASTPMETSKLLLKDKEAEDVDVHLYRSMIRSLMYLTASRPDIIFADSPFDLEAYTDSDYAGASLDRKSTIGAEYVAAASCYGQTVSEASTRSHLKLEDFDGISNLPTTEIFEQLALMGSKKTAWEQFSSNIATAIICLATNRKFNFSKMIFDGMGPVVQGEGSTHPVESHHTHTSALPTSQPPISSPSRRLTRQESVVPQPRSPTQTNVTDEAASTGVDVRLGGATTTVTGLEAE
ncbi:putative ribonuclease H-like domain-containing protein [Tanacetum coccineum]